MIVFCLPLDFVNVLTFRQRLPWRMDQAEHSMGFLWRLSLFFFAFSSWCHGLSLSLSLLLFSTHGVASAPGAAGISRRGWSRHNSMKSHSYKYSGGKGRGWMVDRIGLGSTLVRGHWAMDKGVFIC
jgi:hypothetical protein